MKKIRKLFLVVALLVFSSTVLPVVSAFTKVANAATEANFSYLTVEKFEDEANVGSTYVIKKAKVWENASGTITESSQQADVKVKDPLGADVSLTDDAGQLSFKVESIGNYSIIYSFGGYSQAITMTAKQGIYSFKFPENVAQIIPAYVNITKYTGKIVLPNPVVLDEEGEEVVGANVEVKVSTAGTYLTSEQLTKNTDGYYEFTPNVVGNWEVRYLYKSADGKVLASETKTFTASNEYNNDYKLQIVQGSSKPTTAVTGVTTTLPTITGKNSVTGDKVDIVYSISAKRVVYNSTTGNKVSEEDATSCISNTNEFTPDQDGDYIITYTAKNFFGNTAEPWEFTISDVKDTKAPVVRLVEPYTTTPTDVDASYVLPEKSGVKNIVIPAIWADDNVDKDLSKLTLTRKIVKSNNDVIYESSADPNKELVFNYDETSYTLDESTQVQATLESGVTFGAGTYTISFIAKDSAGNEATAVSYKLIVDASFVADTEKPELKWSDSEAIPAAARVGETIEFSQPVATDDISTRIKLVVQYQFVEGAENDNNWVTLELKDNKYTIEVVSADKLVIRAVATDAYQNSETIRTEIQIHETNDTQATKIQQVEISSDETGAKQQNEIELRKISYQDDYADFVQVSAYVTVEKDEKTISLETYDMTKDITYGSMDTIVVEDAKVWASYAGNYKVAYVSKDINKNITIYFYSFSVAGYTDTAEIELGKLPTSLNGGTLELGEEIKMPTAEINVPDGYTSTYNVRKVSGPNGELLNKSTFRPVKVGTYVIEYYGSYNDGATDYDVTPVRFTVEVKDTTKPVIGEIYIENESLPIDSTFTIPQFTATDNNEIDFENSKVVISSKSYGSKTIYYGDLTSNREITLKYNEVYTLTFTVKDIAGNTATVTKEIKVGDTISPVITIDESSKTFVPENVKLNSKLTLDLSLITAEDPGNGNLSKDDLVITVTRDGETISNIHGDSKTNYEYNINKAGEYTVSIKITDAVGNVSETVTRKFTVNAAENNGMEKNEIIGTILIVVSVLVLAGVIVYFIVSKKKSDKKN